MFSRFSYFLFLARSYHTKYETQVRSIKIILYFLLVQENDLEFFFPSRYGWKKKRRSN